MSTLRTLLGLASLSLVACASSPKTPANEPAAPAPIAAEPAQAKAEAAPKDDKTAAEKWAEAKTAKEDAAEHATKKEALDPLSEGGELEASSIPKMDLTPAKELRAKSRSDLDASLGSVKNATNVSDAAALLTQRLGKPTWIENGQKRVWVAKDGKQCHRLVLEADGSLEVETAPLTEWRMLSALAQQNACTGEIRRGVPGSSH